MSKIDYNELEKTIKSTLHEGQIIKNETELFRLLSLVDPDSKTIKGNKKTQIKKIVKAYLEYSKYEGNSIKIIEIYEEPQIVSDNRTQGKYITYIETVLLNYLLQQNFFTVDITFRGLLEQLGMVNYNYYNYDYRKEVQEDDGPITSYETNNFFIRSYSLMRKTIDSALNSLTKRNKIRYYKCIAIITNNYEKHRANDKEIQNIMKVEEKVMYDMKVSDKGELFWKGLSKAYYKKVKAILKTKYDWEDYYEEFHIILNDKDSLTKALQENIIKLQKSTLNKNLIKTMNDDAENKYKRQNEALKKEWDEAIKNNIFPQGIGLCDSFETFVRLRDQENKMYPEEYVEVQKLLSTFFLSIVPEDQKALLEYISNKKEKESQK